MPEISSSPDTPTPFVEYFNSIKEMGLGFNPEIFLSLDFERNWELTGNPLFVWGGILVCKTHKLELPYWILDYINQKAKQLTFEDFTKDKRASKTVYDLLGLNFGGSGTFFSQFQDFFVHSDAHLMVEEYLKKKPTPTKTKAFEHVGEKLHQAPVTIRRWHKLINDCYDIDLPDPPPEDWSRVYVRIRTHDPKKKTHKKLLRHN